MRHMGIPELAAVSSIETLKKCHGPSKPSTENRIKITPQIRSSMKSSMGITSPLLKILRKRKHCVHLFSPITNEEIKMAGYSYVDDTDQIELNSKETIWENVFEMLKLA